MLICSALWVLRKHHGTELEINMDYTLENCQKLVDDWIRTYGVRYFSELTNTAILMEEVGELARIMARQYGDQSFKENESDLDLGEEMADILFVLICLANQTGVELEDAFKKSMEKKTNRDKERHSKNPKLQKNSVHLSALKDTDHETP